jgi:hypothetical protein
MEIKEMSVDQNRFPYDKHLIKQIGNYFCVTK